jgi:hypothetical protein
MLKTLLLPGAYGTYIDMTFGVATPRRGNHWYAFLLPFDPFVWALTIFSFFFFCILQGVTLYLLNGFTLSNVVVDGAGLLPFSLVVEQGLSIIPYGVRYFTLILLLACTVLGTGYKSTLRTHLMFPSPDPVPQTFDELADRQDYEVSVVILAELERHFWATSEVRAVKKIRERLEYETDWEECFRKALLNPKRACISWVTGRATVAQRMTLNTTIEPLVWAKDAAIRKFITLGFQENSVYTESFREIIGGLVSLGVVAKWEEDIWEQFRGQGRDHLLEKMTSSSSSSEEEMVFEELLALARPKEDAVPLAFGSLGVVLGFVPTGGLLGAVAFLGERIYYYFNWKMKDRVVSMEYFF